MTEKQNEEMLALADRIRDMAYSGVNDFDNFSSYKLDLIQDCAKKLQASLATPGEEIAFRRAWIVSIRDGLVAMGKLPSGPLGDWAFLFRDQLSDVLDKPTTAPPPAGADAGHTRLMDALKMFLGHLRAESRLIPNAYEIHIKYDDYKKMSDAYFGEKIRTSTVLKKLGGPS